MAKLYFYYSAMNAGKSTNLLQSSHNYEERGMKTLLLTFALDNRFGQNKIASRVGLQKPALTFTADTDLLNLVQQHQPLDCVLIDEAQFLSKEQVKALAFVADELDIPVLCYGIRTDFRGELFEGSQYLLAWADNLNEIKTVCHCGKKATHVLRLDAQGEVVEEGAQVQIGGNESYVSVCRKHFYRQDPFGKK